MTQASAVPDSGLMIIGGEEVPAAGGDSLETRDPRTACPTETTRRFVSQTHGIAVEFGLPTAWARQDSNLDLTDYELEASTSVWLHQAILSVLPCAQLRVPVGSSVPVSVPTSTVNAAVSLEASSCAGTQSR